MNPNLLYLMLDASNPTPLVGLWQSGRWIAFSAPTAQALDGLFKGIKECLNQADVPLGAVRGFIHCEGPGSVLGTRLAAMAIEGWKALPLWRQCPLYSYNKLALVAGSVEEIEPFHIISESRQGRWNVYHSPSKQITLQEDSLLGSLPGKCFHFPQRKGSHQAPEDVVTLDPDISKLPQLFMIPGLLTAAERPTVYSPDQPNYKTWVPQRHRKISTPDPNP